MLNKIIIIFFVGVFSFFQLQAKLNYAVVKLCFEKDGKDFKISTKNRAEATENNFVRYKLTDRYYKKIKLYLDGTPFTKFKPYNDFCFTVYKVPPGRHTLSVNFQKVEYSNLVPKNEYTARFKPDLLYVSKIKLTEGPVAKITIKQSKNKVSLYQALDNKPVLNCEKECFLPIGIPVYFVIKSDNEQVECPVDYELFVGNEYEKDFDCYGKDRILPILKKFVKTHNVKCKVNVEYAFFKVFGDGCIITLEPDKFGLNLKIPTKKMIPLDQQKVKYYLKINDSKKKRYKFDADQKGVRFVPKEGDTIVFEEER